MDLYHILATFGLPTLLVLIFLFLGYRATIWFGKNLAQPLIKKHIEFVDVLARNHVKQTELLERIAEQSSRNKNCVDEVTAARRHEEIITRLDLIAVKKEIIAETVQ